MDIEKIQERLVKGEVSLADANNVPCVMYFERAHPYLPKYNHQTFVRLDKFPTERAVLDELKTYWYVQTK